MLYVLYVIYMYPPGYSMLVNFLQHFRGFGGGAWLARAAAHDFAPGALGAFGTWPGSRGPGRALEGENSDLTLWL